MISPKIDHVALNVSNLEESILFYEDFFGFEIIEQWDDPKQAFMGAGDVVIGLLENPGYDFNVHTLSHIAFSCERLDFKKIVQRIREVGLDIVSGPKPQRAGETVLFRDPSGNVLEVCYPSILTSGGYH